MDAWSASLMQQDSFLPAEFQKSEKMVSLWLKQYEIVAVESIQQRVYFDLYDLHIYIILF